MQSRISYIGAECFPFNQYSLFVAKTNLFVFAAFFQENFLISDAK
jgi:hypothetical protein